MESASVTVSGQNKISKLELSDHSLSYYSNYIQTWPPKCLFIKREK